MPVSAAERDYLLAQVDRLAQTDLNNLWRQAESLSNVDFFGYVSAAFPEVVDVYHQTAGQLAATWFEESNPASQFVAEVAEPLVREQLAKSVQWALGGDGKQAVDRMSGTMQRAIYTGARDTVVINAELTGSRWLRVARPNACAFCRMLATRTGDYAYRSKAAAEGVVGRSVNLSVADRRAIASGQMTREEALARRDEMQKTYQIGRRKGQARTRQPRGKRKAGEKYHDFCHCQAVEIRANQTVEDVLSPDEQQLFQQFSDEYEKAKANAGTTETKKLLSTWRQQNAAVVQAPVDTLVIEQDRKFASVLPLKAQPSRRTIESALEDARVSNPSWTDPSDKAGDLHYRDNCTHCVVAYEMRRQGYDVEAMPTPVGNRGAGRSTDRDILSQFTRPGAQNRPTMLALPRSDDDAETLRAILDSQPSWTRGWISVDWKSGGGHIFAWEKIDGKIVYLEPQDGNPVVTEEIFSRIKKGKIEYIHSADLVPDASVFTGDKRIVRPTSEGEEERALVQIKREKIAAREKAAAEKLAKATPKSIM